MKHVTKNSYEAAYYLARGGHLIAVELRSMPEAHRRKLGYLKGWKVEIEVEKKYVDVWKDNKAQCLVKDLRSARRKLKRKIYETLSK